MAAIALAALAAAAPALPAALASIAAPGAVTNRAGMGGGAVMVTRCSRGFLLANWHCRGDFTYSDPMASDPLNEGLRVFPNVVLANDPRQHEPGERVGASLRPGTHRAYLWGNSHFAGDLLELLGFVLCAVAGGVVLLGRRHVRTSTAGAMVTAGALCLSPALVGLWRG